MPCETALKRYPVTVRSFVGQLGHLNVLLPEWILWIHPLALLAAALADPRDPSTLGLLHRLGPVALLEAFFAPS